MIFIKGYYATTFDKFATRIMHKKSCTSPKYIFNFVTLPTISKITQQNSILRTHVIQNLLKVIGKRAARNCYDLVDLHYLFQLVLHWCRHQYLLNTKPPENTLIKHKLILNITVVWRHTCYDLLLNPHLLQIAENILI